MISIEQISGEIAALEEERPTHAVMQKLAALYTVRDHMTLDKEGVQSSAIDPFTIVTSLDSEFASKIDGKKQNDVIPILDELMSTIMALNPGLYGAVIRKIDSI